MINLSMEIPTAYLNHWSPWCDLDFALAHRVLEDKAYREHYKNRTTGRELILDNSMHELGFPLPTSDLKRAADMVDADIVVAPDRLGEVENNRQWFHETYDALSSSYCIAVVMCGQDAEARRNFLTDVCEADVLMLPFREPRLAWFEENRTFIRQNWNRIHLLGVSELAELIAWSMIASTEPFHTERQVKWSVDTAKAVKWGLLLRHLDDGSSLRGAPMSSKDLLDVHSLSMDQQRVIRENTHILRTSCV